MQLKFNHSLGRNSVKRNFANVVGCRQDVAGKVNGRESEYAMIDLIWSMPPVIGA